MQKLLLLLVLSSTFSCAQPKVQIQGDTEWQKQMNSDFKDVTKSPLKKKDLATFNGLDFFKFDSTYIVTGTLKRTPEAMPFKMKTTTSRLPEYVKYGEITFDLNGKAYKLNIYQNLGLMEQKEYVDYLFLPFLDDTNGDTSYGGGRYVEGQIPEGDEIVIDFNKAYNPYCTYNEKYSCPIVPRDNYLAIEIKAGVKAFEKH